MVDAGDLDGVLEGEEQPLRRAHLGVHVEQVLAHELDGALGDLVVVLAREDRREGALAGAVRPHDGVDLAGVDVKVDALEDRLLLDAGVQILDRQHNAGKVVVYRPPPLF